MNMFINEAKTEVKRVFRNPYFIFGSLMMPIVFYVIFTKVVNQGYEQADLWNKHFLMSIAAFSVMGSAIMTLGIRMVQERNQGWTTYLRITPLPNTYHFIAKMIGQSTVHALSIIIIFAFGVILNGVKMTFLEWILCGSWILLGSIPFLALGVLIGTMRKVDTATNFSNLLYLLLAITGGMWMPMEVLPKAIQAIGTWLPAFHYGSGAWAIIRGEAPGFMNILILVVYLLLFMLLSTYRIRKQDVVKW